MPPFSCHVQFVIPAFSCIGRCLSKGETTERPLWGNPGPVFTTPTITTCLACLPVSCCCLRVTRSGHKMILSLQCSHQQLDRGTHASFATTCGNSFSKGAPYHCLQRLSATQQRSIRNEQMVPSMVQIPYNSRHALECLIAAHDKRWCSQWQKP